MFVQHNYGAGRCLLISVLNGLNTLGAPLITFETLIVKLLKYIFQHKTELEPFCPNLEVKMNAYLLHRIFDNDFVDMVPQILANIFNVNIRIITPGQLHHDDTILVINPENAISNDYLTLLRSNSRGDKTTHYTTCIKHGSYTTEMANIANNYANHSYILNKLLKQHNQQSFQQNGKGHSKDTSGQQQPEQHTQHIQVFILTLT